MGQDQANTSGGKKPTKPATTVLRQGVNSLSGYMVASGDSATGFACRVGDTDIQGDFSGPEGEPCSAEVSVK